MLGKVEAVQVHRTVGGDEEPKGHPLVQGEAGDNAVLVIDVGSKGTHPVGSIGGMDVGAFSPGVESPEVFFQSLRHVRRFLIPA